MTSSRRCSSRRAARLAVALAAALAASACGHRPTPPRIGLAEPGGRPRIVVLPLDNLAAAPAPTKELLATLEAAFRKRVDVVDGNVVERFLARHRVRHTGGIDAASARAAREELSADALLITSLEVYRPAGPPAMGLSMRLVSTEDPPAILWTDAFARSGDEAPGLLGLGLVHRIEPIRDSVVAQLVGGLGAFLDGKGHGERCEGGGRYAPKVRYQSRLADAREPPTVAVVPFLNLTARRGAGDAVALEFVRQLVQSGRYRVLEPGVVRDYLLRARVIMPGGVSLETTRLFLGALGAELVLSGVVIDFEYGGGKRGPTIRFSATLLDGGSGDVVWSSGSFNRGDDGVFAFGLGRVSEPQTLTCRMVASVVDRIGHGAGTDVVWRDDETDPRRFIIDGREARATRQAGAGSGAGR